MQQKLNVQTTRLRFLLTKLIDVTNHLFAKGSKKTEMRTFLDVGQPSTPLLARSSPFCSLLSDSVAAPDESGLGSALGSVRVHRQPLHD